jgi:hypothetical protein
MDPKILWCDKELLLKRNFRRGTNYRNYQSKIWGYKHSNPNGCSCYRTPSMKTRDARVLDFISTISDGKSSRLYKKIVDDKKWPCKLVRLVIVKKITERISFMVYRTKYLWKSTYWNWCRNRKLQTELISDKELQNFKTSTRINM